MIFTIQLFCKPQRDRNYPTLQTDRDLTPCTANTQSKTEHLWPFGVIKKEFSNFLSASVVRGETCARG